MNAPAALPRWDFSALYSGPDDPLIGQTLTAAAALADTLAEQHKGRVASLDPHGLAGLLGEYQRALALAYGPQMYASLRLSTDGSDDVVRSMHGAVNERSTDALNRMRFIDVELARAPDEVFARWSTDPSLAEYRHHLQRARASAPHVLPTEVETALSTKDLTGRRAWSQLYNDLVSGWSFELDGRTLNLADLRALRERPERAVRERAHAMILERLEQHSQTLGFVVNTLYQDHRLENDLRGYASPEAPTLLDDEIPPGTLDALMSAVEGHYPVAQRYFRTKARALGLAKMSTHDVLAPYPGGERSVTWDEARDEVLSAFDALDPRVATIARRFFDEGRIDAEPRPGKRDGAFCTGMTPGTSPRVLVNFHGSLRDIYTLAHELGHGVHFALAAEKQRLLNYWPTSPMAETASVFGEMVLTRRLLAREGDPGVRRQLLAARIEEALGTIHRQVAFTRYERNAHAKRAEAVVPVEGLSSLWDAELARLYGDSVERSAMDRWGWAGVPHLVHYRFYCYSYAFGQLLVFALYRQWEKDPEGFVPRYMELLAGGGSDTPQGLVSRMGIDLTDPRFWSDGLDVVTRLVEEFDKEVPGGP